MFAYPGPLAGVLFYHQNKLFYTSELSQFCEL